MVINSVNIHDILWCGHKKEGKQKRNKMSEIFLEVCMHIQHEGTTLNALDTNDSFDHFYIFLYYTNSIILLMYISLFE